MAASSGRTLNVDISVEKLLEQEIEEISRSGEEKYKKPLSLSEELIEFAHKIDFLGDEEKTIEEDEENETQAEKKSESFEAGKWPWESVRNKLRNALSEMCVLLDVLQIMKEKRYLVLEPVSQNPEPAKQAVQMIGKRRSLAKAADVIKQGADRMCQKKEDDPMTDITEVPVPKSDFFSELMKLRQKWRIKKTGNAITGDLSYKSAGSTFWHPGMFEVRKTQDVPEEEVEDPNCSLSVRVSSDLEGFSRVRVEIVDPKEVCGKKSTKSKPMKSSDRSSDVSPWHRKLKQAQFNLFCKELYAQISREAFQSASLNTAQVTGNTIRLQLCDDAYAEIIYEKGMKDEEYSYENVISGVGDALEFRLQQKLHEQHKKNIDMPIPHPSTSTWTTRENSTRDLHGFLAVNNTSSRQSKQCLLESFADELKHVVLRKRVCLEESLNRLAPQMGQIFLSVYTKKHGPLTQLGSDKDDIFVLRATGLLDRLSSEFKDPFVISDWSSAGGPTSSYANIQFLSKRRRLAHKTSYHLTIGVNSLKVIDMDGTVVELHGTMADLEAYLEDQVPAHFSKVALGVFEEFGWTVLQFPHILSQANKEDLEITITARSRKNNCWINLSIGQSYSVKACVQKTLGEEKDRESLAILDKKWSKIEGKTEQIDWESRFGNTFVEKLYNLVASLS